jgi:transcriptional regulator with XRE-family HTH domain
MPSTPTERGVTEVSSTGSNPTVRRRELGALLRELRIERGWTVDQVADRLQVSPSKVSRFETGQRGVSAQDIRSLCDLYAVDSEQRQLFTELAREARRRAQRQPFSLPYSTYIRLEEEAISIRDYGIGIVPGLLQTPDYARAVLRAGVPKWVPDIVENRVSGRIARQRVLYAERPPRLDAVVDESVLHRIVGNRAIMRAQLGRLLEVAALPNLTLRVVPFEAGAPPAANHKFIILSFAPPAVSDVVYIEGLTGEQWIEDPHEVEVYNLTFRRFLDLAASPDRTREMIAAMITRYDARLN